MSSQPRGIRITQAYGNVSVVEQDQEKSVTVVKGRLPALVRLPVQQENMQPVTNVSFSRIDKVLLKAVSTEAMQESKGIHSAKYRYSYN